MIADDWDWLVEEACMNAWPCPRQLIVDGYLLRAAGGTSRRINSVNPLRGAGAPEPAILACERIYAGLGRRPIFRVPGLAPRMDPILARRGYAVEAETCTLFRDLDGLPMEPDPGTALAQAPGEDWLALRDAVNGAATARAFREAAAALALPRAFAAVAAQGGIGAIAFAVLDRSLVVMESVATPAPLRGRGLARRAVAALLRWGRGEGATAACLQVQADNAPARALYAGLGFGRELYRYHYRVRPEAD
jgi:N-acetylglutamate synthase